MKTKLSFFPIIMVLMVMALLPSSVSADTETQTPSCQVVYLQKYSYTEINPELDTERKRLPSPSIMCVITPQGISFSSSSPDEIVTYEVWSITDESPIASFSQESDFLDYLFTVSMNTELQIRLITPEYQLIGTLSD